MGVYDLPVSESIWRLLDPGEQAIDAGANIGYMTSIMAAKAGSYGRVIAFEPHPHPFSILQGNVGRGQKFTSGRVTVHRVALSNRSDIPIEVSRLDHYVTNRNVIGLLKVDVEGHELQVFQGSETLLAGRGIRDIVFEEFRDYPTPVTAFLERFGYTVYQLDMTFWGPILRV
jgi:hypothetical protein